MNNFVTNKSKLPQDGAQVFPYMGVIGYHVTLWEGHMIVNHPHIWGDWLSCDPMRGSHDSQSPHIRTYHIRGDRSPLICFLLIPSWALTWSNVIDRPISIDSLLLPCIVSFTHQYHLSSTHSSSISWRYWVACSTYITLHSDRGCHSEFCSRCVLIIHVCFYLPASR